MGIEWAQLDNDLIENLNKGIFYLNLILVEIKR